MKRYLSFGAGVNSTALMLLLEREGVEFESVFADHGGDYPETYEYVKYLQHFGYQITVIKPCESGCSTIEEYALKYRILPSVQTRWCTMKFKIKPLMNYYEKPCIEFIGFCASEKRRVDRYHNSTWKRWKRGIKVEFPLVEKNITRNDCIGIIKDAGLRVPIPSVLPEYNRIRGGIDKEVTSWNQDTHTQTGREKVRPLSFNLLLYDSPLLGRHGKPNSTA